MKTIIVFRAERPNDQQTVRFASENTPNLHIGDTFRLPLMVNLGHATVEKRHWHGQELVTSCKVSPFLIKYLVDNSAKKIPGHVDDYLLPDQDWSAPFEE